MARPDQKNQPESYNFLEKSSFKFEIQKLPELNYFVTKANLPGISGEGPNLPNRFTTFALIPDSASFEYLEVEFVIDENLKNWIAIWDWISNMTFTRDHAQWLSLVNDPISHNLSKDGGLGNLYSDGFLSIITTSKTPIPVTAKFHNMYPTSLSQINFDSHLTDATPQVATVRFQYQVYTLETPWRHQVGTKSEME